MLKKLLQKIKKTTMIYEKYKCLKCRKNFETFMLTDVKIHIKMQRAYYDHLTMNEVNLYDECIVFISSFIIVLRGIYL